MKPDHQEGWTASWTRTGRELTPIGSSCFLSGRERIEADVANELEKSGTGSRLSGRERLIGNALIVCRERAGASRERELDELGSGWSGHKQVRDQDGLYRDRGLGFSPGRLGFKPARVLGFVDLGISLGI